MSVQLTCFHLLLQDVRNPAELPAQLSLLLDDLIHLLKYFILNRIAFIVKMVVMVINVILNLIVGVVMEMVMELTPVNDLVLQIRAVTFLKCEDMDVIDRVVLSGMNRRGRFLGIDNCSLLTGDDLILQIIQERLENTCEDGRLGQNIVLHS